MNMSRTSCVMIDGIDINFYNEVSYERIRSKYAIPQLTDILGGSLNNILSSMLKSSRNGSVSTKETACKKFCVRTINDTERACLMSLLSSGWTERILEQQTLLTQIYGHFSLGESAHFILIPNRSFRYSDIEVVDAETSEYAHNITVRNREAKDRISKIISSDCQWLSARKVVSYSVSFGLLNSSVNDHPTANHLFEGKHGKIEVVIDDWFVKTRSHKSILKPFRKAIKDPKIYGKTITTHTTIFLNSEQSKSSKISSCVDQSNLSSLELDEKECTGGESFEELLSFSSQLIDNDRPAKAVKVYRLAKKQLESKGESIQSNKYCNDSRVVAAALCEKELVAVLEDMGNDDIWVNHGDSRGCKVQLDKNSQGGMLRFRVEQTINMDLFSSVAVMNECADFKDWMPGFDQSEIKTHISMFRRILRMSGKPPWPLKRNEVMLKAYGDTVNAKDILGPDSKYGHGVFLYMCPAGEDVPRSPGYHQLEVTGGYWFESVEENKTRIINIACLDLHANIPNWIINWLVVNIAYLLLPMLYKQSKQYAPGGSLHHRVTDNPQLYTELKRRLKSLTEKANNRNNINNNNNNNKGASVLEVKNSKHINKNPQQLVNQVNTGNVFPHHHRKHTKKTKVSLSSTPSSLSTFINLVFVIYLSISAWLSIGLAILFIMKGVYPSQSGAVTGVALGLSRVLWKQLSIRGGGGFGYICTLSIIFSIVTGLCAVYPDVPEFIFNLNMAGVEEISLK